jgi:hypothetical protein
MSFRREDLCRLQLDSEENLQTKTQYNVEHVFYLEKP